MKLKEVNYEDNRIITRGELVRLLDKVRSEINFPYGYDGDETKAAIAYAKEELFDSIIDALKEPDVSKTDPAPAPNECEPCQTGDCFKKEHGW